MRMNDYQVLAGSTAIYPGQGSFLGLMYVTGKLNGEAGEVAEGVFKGLRDGGLVYNISVNERNPHWQQDAVNVNIGWLGEERRMKLKKELGDVLWYVAMAAKELGFELEEIAEDNVSKLSERKQAGTLHGSGSDR